MSSRLFLSRKWFAFIGLERGPPKRKRVRRVNVKTRKPAKQPKRRPRRKSVKGRRKRRQPCWWWRKRNSSDTRQPREAKITIMTGRTVEAVEVMLHHHHLQGTDAVQSHPLGKWKSEVWSYKFRRYFPFYIPLDVIQMRDFSEVYLSFDSHMLQLLSLYEGESNVIKRIKRESNNFIL